MTRAQLDVCPFCDACVWWREGDEVAAVIDDRGRVLWVKCDACEGVAVGDKIVSREDRQ